MQVTSMAEHSDVLMLIISSVLTILGVCVIAVTKMAVKYFQKLETDVCNLYESRNEHAERLAKLEAQHEQNHGPIGLQRRKM